MTRPLEDELRAHAGALRALARLLVSEQDADDLVQETALRKGSPRQASRWS